jgi:hypothetical protein
MKTIFNRAWVLGFLVIVFFVVVGELTTFFHEYFYYRMGFDRDLVLTILWFFPFAASFMTSYLAVSYKFSLGMSHALTLPFMGSIAHYINGKLGGVIDFSGMLGAIVVFKVYFVGGVVSAIAGVALGILLSRKTGDGTCD